MGIVFLYGNEPYAIDAHKNKALSFVGNDPMNRLSRKGQFNAEVLSLCRTYPFLAEKKGITLDCDTLDDLDTKFFKEYLDKPSSFTELVIICRKVDARKKLLKTLKERKVAIQCNKLQDDKAFQKVILYEVKHVGAQITADALREFSKRINYFGKEDMNLLTAVGYIKNVAAVTKEIRIEDIERFVPAFEDPDVFALAKLLKEKDMTELLRQINMIPAEEAIQILSLLLRSFRISFKVRYFDQKEVVKSYYKDLFGDYPVDVLKDCINVLTDTISSIKGGMITEELALKSACGKVAALL